MQQSPQKAPGTSLPDTIRVFANCRLSMTRWAQCSSHNRPCFTPWAKHGPSSAMSQGRIHAYLPPYKVLITRPSPRPPTNLTGASETLTSIPALHALGWFGFTSPVENSHPGSGTQVGPSAGLADVSDQSGGAQPVGHLAGTIPRL